MLSIILWQSFHRILAGAFFLIAFTLFLPEDMIQRQLWGGVIGLLAPLLVLGRRTQFKRESYDVFSRTLKHPRRWELQGIFPSLTMIGMWAFVVSRADPREALIYFCWYLMCLMIGELCDLKRERLGEAWAYTSVSIILFMTAPLWGALWFGVTPLRPWVATLSLGLNPVFSAASSVGEGVLQNPTLYAYTLSGLVEVRSLAWWYAPLCYFILSWILLELITRSALNTEGRRGVY